MGAILLGPTDLIKEGDTVHRTHHTASIRVGEALAGRVINPLGEPIDGLGEIRGELVEMPLERKAPGVIFRQPVNQPLQTGIKAVATVRRARPPSLSTRSSTSVASMRPAIQSTASM